MSSDLHLERALHDAVIAQFMHLFSVLVKDVSNREEALKRFRAGLVNLAEAEKAVTDILQEKK
jgi:hypothetical protein